MPSSKDRIGKYFLCYEEACGHSSQIEIAIRDLVGKIHSVQTSHADHDGFGAMSRLDYFKNQEPLRLPSFPKIRQPNLYAQLSLLAAHLRHMSKLPRPNLDLKPSEPKNFHAFEYLSEEQSLAIENACRQIGITQTSFLTWTLHQALSSASGVDDLSCNWSIPVNIRGSRALASEVGNQSVPIFFHLSSRNSPKEAHRLIAAQLYRRHYWGVFRMLMMLSYLPKSLYKVLIRIDERKNKLSGRWIAILSNLGALEGNPKIEPTAFIISTNPSAPLKSVVLGWNKRLALALNVHSSLSSDKFAVDELLNCWLQKINLHLQNSLTATSTTSTESAKKPSTPSAVIAFNSSSTDR